MAAKFRSGGDVKKQIIVAGLIALSLAGCATRKESDVGKGAEVAVKESRDGLGDAVLAPAEDLNIRREEIPQILIDLTAVYGPVSAEGCELIIEEVTALSAVLGPDEDVLKAKASRSEKLGKGTADMALNAVEDASTGFIPFRSLVRRATGATAYEKKVRAAYQRGLLRRTYLKGVGAERGCPPPGSPIPTPPEEPTK